MGKRISNIIEYKFPLIQKRILEYIESEKEVVVGNINFQFKINVPKRIAHLILLSELKIIEIYFKKGNKLVKVIDLKWKNKTFDLPEIC